MFSGQTLSLVTQELQQQADLASLAKQVESAKSKAQVLYEEVLNVIKRTQDATIQSVSIDVTPIPKDSCQLKLYNTLKGHQNKVAKICWNYDSSKILSASQDGYMILWDAITGYKKQAIQLDNPYVLTCSMSSNEKLVAGAGLDNICTIYKIKPDTSNVPVVTSSSINNKYNIQMHGNFYQSIQSTFKGHSAYISECEFIGNNSIVTSSGDMTCMLWDITKGCKSRDFIDHIGDVLTMTIFPQNILNNNLFISGSSDGYAKVWDLRSPTPTQNFQPSSIDVTSLKVFPDGNAFVLGTDDGLIRLFDLRSDCQLGQYNLNQELRNNQNIINTSHKVLQSPKDYRNCGYQKQPLSSTTEKSFDKVSLNSMISNFENQGVFSLDFGKSGRFLYSCYSEFGCVVWDTLKNEIIGSIGSDHSDKINKVAVSPDGIGLATGSWDSTIKVWSV
ncbi:unnamed protein product [Candida verbasci]|uniref:Guanine nucleotide-binding protein subunit beta n=1 Tax=Candida verbasci TaxID=1227364 RepID=A0A9W4TST2_9ASCO|nr:unnamed protein product [Candida verbasci]